MTVETGDPGLSIPGDSWRFGAAGAEVEPDGVGMNREARPINGEAQPISGEAQRWASWRVRRRNRWVWRAWF